MHFTMIRTSTTLGSAGAAQVLTEELDGPARGLTWAMFLAEAAGHITGQFAKDKRLLKENLASQSTYPSPSWKTATSCLCFSVCHSSLKLPSVPVPVENYVLLISERFSIRLLASPLRATR